MATVYFLLAVGALGYDGCYDSESVPMTSTEKSADSRSPSALECVTKALGLCPLATEGTQEPSLFIYSFSKSLTE
jgi:hypothetical protein